MSCCGSLETGTIGGALAEPLSVAEFATAPGARTDGVVIYGLDVGGVTHLYAKTSDGTAYQLTTGGGGGPVTGVGVAGQDAYWSGVTTVAGAYERQWDNTNKRMAIGASASAIITPTTQLEISTDSLTNTTRGIMVAQHNAGTNAALFQFQKSRGTRAAVAAIANADYIGAVAATPHDGTSYLANTAYIGFLVNGTVAAGSVPTDIVFYTGATTTSTLAMTINSSQQVILSSGTTSPVISGTTNTTTGFSFEGTAINIVNSGFRRISFCYAANGDIATISGGSIGWSSSASSSATAMDTILVRDAANTLALKNGTTAQTFNIYGTTTGSKYLSLTHDGTNAKLMSIGTNTTLYLQTNGQDAWFVNASSHLLPVGSATNTVDIGGASNLVRTLYIGTSIDMTTSGAIVKLGGGTIRNAGGSLDFNNSANTTTYISINNNTGGVTYQGTVNTSGTAILGLWTMSGHTGQTASTEISSIKFNLSATRQWATGAITTQREFLLQAPTYGFVGASTVTYAATFAVSGPPIVGTNATLTNAFAILAQGGGVIAAMDSGNTKWVLSTHNGTDGIIGSTAGDLRFGTSVTGQSMIMAFTGTQGFHPVTNDLIYIGTTSARWARLHTSQRIDNTGDYLQATTARTSGVAAYFTVTTPADTTLTASTESIGVNFATGTRQWATGALTTQREHVIAAPTYAFVGASTITTAATFAISAAPIAGTNATLTNTYAFLIQSGAMQLPGVGSGGNTTPTIAWATSPNSGIYSHTTHSTNITANGVMQVYVDSNGISCGTLIRIGSAPSTPIMNIAYSATAGMAVTNAGVSGSGARVLATWTTTADTNQTASTEINGINFNLSATRQWATGAITTQREFLVQAPTYGFVGASTITNAYTFVVSGPPIVGTNATITNRYAALIGGMTRIDDGTQGFEFVPGASGNIIRSAGTLRSLYLRIGATSGWYIDSSLFRFQAEINYGFSHGTSALATNATEGFLFIQSCAGTATGTPATIPTGQKAIVYDSTNDVLMVYNGAWKTIVTGGLSGLTAYKGSDQTVTTTTLAADTALTVTVVAGAKYTFRIKIFFNNGGAGEGIKVALSGTSTMTTMSAQVFIYDDTLNTLTALARITALDSSHGAGISSGDNFAIIEGTIDVNTGGTFLLQFAQNATGASAGVSVQKSSVIELIKL